MEKLPRKENKKETKRRSSFASLMGAATLAGMLSGDTPKASSFDISGMFTALEGQVIDTPERLLKEMKFEAIQWHRLAPVDALYPGSVPRLTEEQRNLTSFDALNNPAAMKSLPEGFSEWTDYRVAMQMGGYNWWRYYDFEEDREVVARNNSFFDTDVGKICYREGAAVVDHIKTEDSEGEKNIGRVTFISLAKPSPFSRDVQPVDGLPPIEIGVVAESYESAILKALAEIRQTDTFQQLVDRPTLPAGIEKKTFQSPQRGSVAVPDSTEVTFESRSVSVQFCMAGVRIELVPGKTDQYTFTGSIGEIVPR